jgi:hypothetical protein
MWPKIHFYVKINAQISQAKRVALKWDDFYHCQKTAQGNQSPSRRKYSPNLVALLGICNFQRL